MLLVSVIPILFIFAVAGDLSAIPLTKPSGFVDSTLQAQVRRLMVRRISESTTINYLLYNDLRNTPNKY